MSARIALAAARTFCAACFTLALAALFAAPAAASVLLYDYNLVVGGDLVSTSNIRGKTVVGGSVTGANSADFAQGLNAADNSGVVTLLVGGDIATGNPLNIGAGDVRTGGSVSRILNFNGGGTLTSGDPTAPAAAQSIIDQIAPASDYYAGLTADSSVSPAGTQPAAVKFTATPGADNVAVFEVDAARFSDSKSQQYELLFGAGVDANTLFVFNVSGSSVTFNQGNFVGDFNNASRRPNMIWNFYEATTIDFDRMWNGTVLAPLADLTIRNNVEGSVFVGGDFDQRGEVHFPLFAGPTPPSPPPPGGEVPEPAAMLVWAMLGVTLGGVLRRR
ncbi:hypothetical protein Mal64_01590 [Pseudobythopirellula maris]|uniref:Choice-of-anchor A domain-containing protein n=1 Tax=Pseudobythopirellula maris TaxID=2527991 RepID=A0A5C5ZR69_9BACT|nr:choice-of-anchor A family protein [Pseudobythopirellula maris]TWT89780.1 hypothetical protein Mal64_01590 [Pseudobythopirellula maris]